MPKLKYDPRYIEDELEFIEALNKEADDYLDELVKFGHFRDEEFIRKYKGEEE